jgi:histidyl-tRNA synthetase
MSKLQALKGFKDVLPSESWKWQAVERVAAECARLFHFQEIRTPVLESARVYDRGVGESSDMVRKETYTFPDRDGEAVTLRPEGTAGVVRAVIEAGLLNDEGSRCKVYYIGENFRHERPQKGRLRQHTQFGAEAFGIAGPEQDVECILLQLEFYRRCGLKDLSLRVNSLGDGSSKAAYRAALREHLEPMRDSLSPDSVRRLEENPLRILDSKDPRDVEACRNAPAAFESLSDSSRKHLESVERLLSDAGVVFVRDPTLVRGFDYYTETLWEVTTSGLGAQNAIGGGGRYDNLVEVMGGRKTPGVGFGAGLERLLLALEAQQVQLPGDPRPLVWLVYHGETARGRLFSLLHELRRAGIACDMDLAGRAVKAQMKLADRASASLCVVAGDAELADGSFLVKRMSDGSQVSIGQSQLVSYLEQQVAGRV